MTSAVSIETETQTETRNYLVSFLEMFGEMGQMSRKATRRRAVYSFLKNNEEIRKRLEDSMSGTSDFGEVYERRFLPGLNTAAMDALRIDKRTFIVNAKCFLRKYGVTSCYGNNDHKINFLSESEYRGIFADSADGYKRS